MKDLGTEIRRCESDASAKILLPSAATASDCATMFRVVRPSPVVILSTAIVLGTATFVAVPLLAQNMLAQNEPAKPAEAGKPAPAKPDSAKAEPAKADPAKTDPAKTEAAKGGEQAKGEPGKGEPGKDAASRSGDVGQVDGTPTLTGPAGRLECVWLGERVIGLMWKDDLDTAFRHLALYDRFGCPGEHVRLSFRCVVLQGNVQKDPKVIAELFDSRVHNCWRDPAARPIEPASPPTAAAEKPGGK
jgi:hypothetical protein